jgi:hypothetical protein
LKVCLFLSFLPNSILFILIHHHPPHHPRRRHTHRHRRAQAQHSSTQEGPPPRKGAEKEKEKKTISLEIPEKKDFLSKDVLEVFGKKPWEAEKMKEEEETFFRLDKNDFEDPSFLPVRKELWGWMVKCMVGEQREKLFCAHLVDQCDSGTFSTFTKH